MATPTAEEIRLALEDVQRAARTVLERGTAPTNSLMIALRKLAGAAGESATTVYNALPPGSEERALADRYLALKVEQEKNLATYKPGSDDKPS